jgi:hypothetical protein
MSTHIYHSSTYQYKNKLSGIYISDMYQYLLNLDWLTIKEFTPSSNIKLQHISLSYGQNPYIDSLILIVMNIINTETMLITDININYYRDGNDYSYSTYSPNKKRVAILFNEKRNITISRRTYPVSNGDIIFFGPASYSVNIDPKMKLGTIIITVTFEQVSLLI